MKFRPLRRNRWLAVEIDGRWVTCAKSGSTCDKHTREWLWRGEYGPRVIWFCRGGGGHLG